MALSQTCSGSARARAPGAQRRCPLTRPQLPAPAAPHQAEATPVCSTSARRSAQSFASGSARRRAVAARAAAGGESFESEAARSLKETAALDELIDKLMSVKNEQEVRAQGRTSI